ncbi:Hypothetical predicted protein [Olea europaea subsp. europaea]|uniref:Uncharacterized protein n=1 Tax=Olea europaea subsp. europaea TaxID=158383 RepID=A0A8S0VL93_OLEEU|nr:Hypothetical predicted protein [Olea europaea subsp. europaea]
MEEAGPTNTAGISASAIFNVMNDIETYPPPAQKHELRQPLGGHETSHRDCSQFATANCPANSPVVASTSERTAALASTVDDKKLTESFYDTCIASPIDQKHESYECDVCNKCFLS